MIKMKPFYGCVIIVILWGCIIGSHKTYAQFVLPSQQQFTVSNQSSILFTREQFRVMEEKNGGFRWVPWLSAGERIWKFVLARDPKAKDVIGDGQNIDIAVKDINYDGSNEVIVSFWGDCGTDGCLYKIYFNSDRRPVSLMGHTMRPFGHGVKLDVRYFQL